MSVNSYAEKTYKQNTITHNYINSITLLNNDKPSKRDTKQNVCGSICGIFLYMITLKRFKIQKKNTITQT